MRLNLNHINTDQIQLKENEKDTQNSTVNTD